MRTAIIISGVVIAGALASCGSGSPSTGSGNTGSGDGGVAADAGVTGADAGAGQGGGTDAGTTDAGGDQGSGGSGGGGSGGGGGSDGGAGGGGSDGGTSGGGGSGGTSDGGSGGQTASDCDGLLPPAPGAPSQFRWTGRNIGGAGACLIGDVDGTGHIALLWQNQSLGDSHYVFVDGSANSIGGSYSGTGPLELIGQSSGFMGIECSDVFCRQGGAYVVLDPAGAVLYRSASDRIPYTSDRVPPNPAQINDPTGGMIRVRLKDDGSNYLLLLDAIDASGGIRWTRQVPETWPDTGIVPVPIVGGPGFQSMCVTWMVPGGMLNSAAKAMAARRMEEIVVMSDE